DIRAGAGEFEDGGAPEAVADGGGVFAIYHAGFFELFQTGANAFAEKGAILLVFTGGGGSFADSLGANAFAINIGDEGDIAEFSQHFGAPFLVITGALPLVDDEDAGAFADDSIVVNEIAFERGVAFLVLDRFGFDGSQGGRGAEQSENQKCLHSPPKN